MFASKVQTDLDLSLYQCLAISALASPAAGYFLGKTVIAISSSFGFILPHWTITAFIIAGIVAAIFLTLLALGSLGLVGFGSFVGLIAHSGIST